MSHLSYLANLGAHIYSDGSIKFWRFGEKKETETVCKIENSLHFWVLLQVQETSVKTVQVKKKNWFFRNMLWGSHGTKYRNGLDLRNPERQNIQDPHPPITIPSAHCFPLPLSAKWVPRLPNIPTFPLLERNKLVYLHLQSRKVQLASTHDWTQQHYNINGADHQYHMDPVEGKGWNTF